MPSGGLRIPLSASWGSVNLAQGTWSPVTGHDTPLYYATMVTAEVGPSRRDGAVYTDVDGCGHLKSTAVKTALSRATAVAAVSKLSEGPKWAAPFFKPRNCRGAPQCGTARVGEGKAADRPRSAAPRSPAQHDPLCRFWSQSDRPRNAAALGYPPGQSAQDLTRNSMARESSSAFTDCWRKKHSYARSNLCESKRPI